MKATVSQIKNTLEAISGRLAIAEEKISEFENKAVRTI